ncbi:low affinity iron permease family protein (plasmid) [Pseudomonas nitroreducens]|uniref:Low affinity iron permease family protein n=1 Tax=Pseudomonas nitroreducens TaxID=46680 RepID=A0A6G6J8Y4_PSENT|nr:low affinity iron permease family protein [Pseudomonas nitroreducens]
MAVAWPLLVVWGGIQVAKSLQVYEKAQVMVLDKEACVALQLPFDDGCRVEGRLEANLDHSWWLQPNGTGSVFIRLPPGAFPFSYSPDDYRITGGKPAVIALVGVTVVLALFGPFFSWRGRKMSAPAK